MITGDWLVVKDAMLEGVCLTLFVVFIHVNLNFLTIFDISALFDLFLLILCVLFKLQQFKLYEKF